MAIDLTRHVPDDEPLWTEATYENVSYRFQIVGEDDLRLTATGQDGRVDAEPPAVVLGRLESSGYPEVRTRGPEPFCRVDVFAGP